MKITLDSLTRYSGLEKSQKKIYMQRCKRKEANDI